MTDEISKTRTFQSLRSAELKTLILLFAICFILYSTVRLINVDALTQTLPVIYTLGFIYIFAGVLSVICPSKIILNPTTLHRKSFYTIFTRQHMNWSDVSTQKIHKMGRRSWLELEFMEIESKDKKMKLSVDVGQKIKTQDLINLVLSYQAHATNNSTASHLNHA